MKYTVNLKVFKDDVTDDWGVAPQALCNTNNSFNAFWHSSGLFHDIFEHWFEGKLKYFCGDSMGCIHGEMVASGIKAWIFYATGFNGFKYTLRGDYSRLNFYEDTSDDLLELISEVYYQYPIIHKAIPNQSIALRNYVDGIVDLYWSYLRDYGTVSQLHKLNIWLSDIRNAYRYGHKLAERLYGKYDPEILLEFFNEQLYFFKNLTTSHINEHVIEGSDYGVRGFTATVNTNHKDEPRVIYKVVDALNRCHSINSLIY